MRRTQKTPEQEASMTPTQRLLDLLDVELPVIQAPMAGASTPQLVAAVSNAGGLGSYGCSRLLPDQVVELGGKIRALTNRSFNLNFFCHAAPKVTPDQERAWRQRLGPYYAKLGVDPDAAKPPVREPFNAAMCEAVVAVAPKMVSFHSGMPEPKLVERVKAAGCVVSCSATTVQEARRLVDLGCDTIVAQGLDAVGIAACSCPTTSARRSAP